MYFLLITLIVFVEMMFQHANNDNTWSGKQLLVIFDEFNSRILMVDITKLHTSNAKFAKDSIAIPLNDHKTNSTKHPIPPPPHSQFTAYPCHCSVPLPPAVLAAY